MRAVRLQLYLILTASGLVLFILTLEALWTERPLVNEPLHAAMEAGDGLAAIVMAILLILKRRENYGGKFFLIAMGFLGMGLLDVFHSASPAGHGFVLLRSVSSFVGASWFALIWVPWCASERDAVWKRWTPWAVVIGAILFGVWTSKATETLPIMVKVGTFTTTAVAINLLAGVFFLAAASRLLIDSGRVGRPEIYLFACMATLFGLANLMFPLSELWDNTWWLWHLLRSASYLLALGFVIHEHQQTISNLRMALAERTKAEEDLRRHRDHLEETVQERTAELRKANKDLHQEIGERKRIAEELRRAREELEVRVQERTQELAKTIEQLNAEIVERQKLQQELIENSRLAAIGTIAAKIAHEIANPLNGMSLTLQRLERQLAQASCLDEAFQTTLRRLQGEIRRLNRLLDDFRSLARRDKYNFQPTDLTAIAREVLAIELENYASKRVHVEQLFPPDLPLVQADRDKLEQALWNLCKNAVEAMPQGGTLTLKAHSADANVVLEVADTGVGIPPGVDIFEPFTTTKGSGSGLGLMVVRQVVAAHGGSVTYTSEPGNGTTFRLTLPLRPPASL